MAGCRLTYLLPTMARLRRDERNAGRQWLAKAIGEIEEAEKARHEKGHDAPIPA